MFEFVLVVVLNVGPVELARYQDQQLCEGEMIRHNGSLTDPKSIRAVCIQQPVDIAKESTRASNAK